MYVNRLAFMKYWGRVGCPSLLLLLLPPPLPLLFSNMGASRMVFRFLLELITIVNYSMVVDIQFCFILLSASVYLSVFLCIHPPTFLSSFYNLYHLSNLLTFFMNHIKIRQAGDVSLPPHFQFAFYKHVILLCNQSTINPNQEINIEAILLYNSQTLLIICQLFQ